MPGRETTRRPDMSRKRAGKAYQNEDISRIISRCRELATRLCWADRRSPKQSAARHGRRGISPQMFHIAELYQTHAPWWDGKWGASRRAGIVGGWRAGLGCVCRGRAGPSGERQCVGSVWMSSGPVKLNGLAACHKLRCVRARRGVDREGFMSVRRPGVDSRVGF